MPAILYPTFWKVKWCTPYRGVFRLSKTSESGSFHSHEDLKSCIQILETLRETTDDTLLEKQAEAIHFLKEHNARLSRKILSLTDQLGRYSDANV